MRSAREIEQTREALEAEDLEQMLNAHNARRQARGQPAQTLEELASSTRPERGPR